MANSAEAIRDRIVRYDAGFQELRRVLASHRYSLESVDPEKEHRDELEALSTVMEQTRQELGRTTDSDRQIEAYEVMARVYAEMACARRRAFDRDVVQRKGVYLRELTREHQTRLHLLHRVRDILRCLPHWDGVKTEEPDPSRASAPDAYHPPSFSWGDATCRTGAIPASPRPGRTAPGGSPAMVNPQVGQLYLGYWEDEKRYYAVMVLPFGSLAPVGIPGSIASTKLLDYERRPCHTRHPDTGAYAWSYGFAKDGDARVLGREFPVVWFSTLQFPARATYSWIEARHLRRFCLGKTPRQFWGTVRDFIHDRNRTGWCVMTDLDHPAADGAPLDVPAVRPRGAALCAQVDAYFDNVVFVEDIDDEKKDPTFVVGNE
ncbi:hypothetical protein E4U42_005151 [Claviceps africana]|uniref:Uncharacterized protein n=1 Tax=Claviceps africana TaxID=83212 RepID=A0A8K0NHJ9_9HYPO|nr:hypothetical protein E4U42_005151 [Claviceps africana]